MKRFLSYAFILMLFMYNHSEARISVPLQALKKKVQQIRQFSDKRLSILSRGMQGKHLNAHDLQQFSSMKKAFGATAIALALAAVSGVVVSTYGKKKDGKKKVGFVDKPEVKEFERTKKETQQVFGKDVPAYKRFPYSSLTKGPSPEGQKKWESEIAYVPKTTQTTMLPGLELSKDERLITQAWLRGELEDDIYEKFDRVKDMYDAKKIDFVAYGKFTGLIMRYINKEIDKKELNTSLPVYK